MTYQVLVPENESDNCCRVLEFSSLWVEVKNFVRKEFGSWEKAAESVLNKENKNK
jgi:hypothetical protein